MDNRIINYSVIQKNNKKYINLTSAETPIGTEDRIMDLISLCFENETNLLLLHSSLLSEDFFKLRTGFAGTLMQKLVNYHIRGALLLPENLIVTGIFKDLMVELKESKEFRVFYNITEAQTWLLDER